MLMLLALLFGAAPAHAHKASDAYLQLKRTGDTIDLRWDIALRDLDAMLDLDSNADRKLSWGEVRTRLADIRAYALNTASRTLLDSLRAWPDAAHATPVGSGTVARTKRIPIEQRAEAATIAWMRHQTTGYDSMTIPREKGLRREVRRMLA
eukprot:gene56444-77358_t